MSARKTAKSELNSTRDALFNRSFLAFVILVVIDAGVFWLGNPLIFEDIAWHHLPEWGAGFFGFSWLAEIGLMKEDRRRIPLGLAVPILVILGLSFILGDVYSLLFASMSSLAIVLGYMVGKKKYFKARARRKLR